MIKMTVLVSNASIVRDVGYDAHVLRVKSRMMVLVSGLGRERGGSGVGCRIVMTL